MDEALWDRIIKAVGGKQINLAKKLGVGSMAVNGWKKRGIPAERVLDVEAATSISRHELRPDLYPRDGKYQAA